MPENPRPTRTPRTRRPRGAQVGPVLGDAPVPVKQVRPDVRRLSARLRPQDIAAAGMRRVQRTDGAGRLQFVLIPATEPDSAAERGALMGPPSLARLDLPLTLEVALNNELFNRGIITEADARARFKDIVAAWQSVLSVGASRIHGCFVDSGT